MSIIGLETSSAVSSVALLQKGRLAAELTMEAKLTHSETLVPHIEEVFSLGKVRKTELEAVAVSIGPGSFTGLRIGLATAKAMAYALEIPLIAVPSLSALACHYMVQGVRIVVIADAQKRNLYRARYHWEGIELVEDHSASVLSIDELLEELRNSSEDTVLVGDGTRRIGDINLPKGIWIAPPQLCMPRAAHIAFLGERMLARGEVSNAMNLEPVYIRRSEAEVLWEKRQAKA